MKRLFLLLVAVAALGVVSSASAKTTTAKCENIAKLHLGKGDCAITMRIGQTLIFPAGVRSQKDYTPSCTPLAVKFWSPFLGPMPGARNLRTREPGGPTITRLW
jgi:hypothetical protein